MGTKNTITIEQAPGGMTRIVVTANSNARIPAAITTTTFPRDGIRALVVDLCRTAGLPAPW
ncbi:hypothetical protein [Spirillospora sp. NBC_01491]|uniref:hypothetical protein n=1 Tax=Spirillospora sp. NBC_01491 TaxID=2976007 RepID=UPI002E3248A9|nr:hypothetical protein [Spirillospora sp. NBC_01491]